MGEGEIPSHENGSLVTQLRERGIGESITVLWSLRDLFWEGGLMSTSLWLDEWVNYGTAL